jgi:hypothetical protein
MTTSGPTLRNTLTAIAAAIAAFWAAGASAAPLVFSVGGDASSASIQATVDTFRAALGDPNNGNTPGPLPNGRREINWDGGVSDATTPPVTPFNVFLDLRGAQFTTPGTGLSQAPPSGGANDGLAGLFGNPTYGSTFGTFSPLRLFTPVGSNITDVGFFIPGSAGAVPAAVGGFGAIFTDVDLSGTTRIQYFDIDGNSLYSAFVEAGTVADASLSFLGVVFDAGEQIARVRITTGTQALGPNDNPGGGVDVVAMDDFLYREPAAIAAVPLPGTLALLAIGLAGMACRRRRG